MAALSNIASSIGGEIKRLLVALDPNGYVAPAHVLVDAAGAEKGVSGNTIVVSTAALPLPAGAATDATLTALERPYQGIVPMTVGTTYPAQRALRINCTSAGNVSVTYADGSVDVLPMNVGLSYVAGAFTAVNSSGTTATATYANVK